MTEDYPVFNLWYQTLGWILDTTGKFPKSARFNLAGRISDISLEVLESIIEAIYTKERSPLLLKANLGLEKLRVLFRLAHDRKHISTRQYEHVSEALIEVGKMIGGWRKQSNEASRESV